MALWTMANDGWVKAPMHGIMKSAKCVICGCGSSLKDAVIPDDRYKIVLNDAYETVKPDCWVALDKPEFFSLDIMEKPITKVLRGGHQKEKIADREASSFPATYFCDIREVPYQCVFDYPHLDYLFCWQSQTMILAVQLAWYLGFKDIAFAGVDLADGRHNDKAFTPEQIEKNRKVWSQQVTFFKWWIAEARKRDITVSSITDGLLRELINGGNNGSD